MLLLLCNFLSWFARPTGRNYSLALTSVSSVKGGCCIVYHGVMECLLCRCRRRHNNMLLMVCPALLGTTLSLVVSVNSLLARWCIRCAAPLTARLGPQCKARCCRSKVRMLYSFLPLQQHRPTVCMCVLVGKCFLVLYSIYVAKRESLAQHVLLWVCCKVFLPAD